MTRARVGRVGVAAALAAGCAEPIDLRTFEVDAPRILAVVAEPPEAEPGAAVRLTAIVVAPDGLVDAPEIVWALCDAPKPIGEPGVVSPACLGDLPAAASGGAVELALPRDACARFGPDTPPGDFRPRDPDETGGYYQPVRLALASDDGGDPAVAFALPRLRCGLGSAPFEVARAYLDRYVVNRNPSLGPLERARADGGREPLVRAARGEVVELIVGWPPAAAEPYVALDLESLAIVERRESLSVAWASAGGHLAVDASGRAEADPGTTAANVWTAPTIAGPVHLWAVLRDSRGGVAVGHAVVDVE